MKFSPFQLSVKNCFIRGSVVRYVQLPADECDTQLLQDAARKEAAQNRQRWCDRSKQTVQYWQLQRRIYTPLNIQSMDIVYDDVYWRFVGCYLLCQIQWFWMSCCFIISCNSDCELIENMHLGYHLDIICKFTRWEY